MKQILERCSSGYTGAAPQALAGLNTSLETCMSVLSGIYEEVFAESDGFSRRMKGPDRGSDELKSRECSACIEFRDIQV